MKSFIILALFALALSTKIIIVGDSRTYIMAQQLFPQLQTKQNYIANYDTPVPFRNHQIIFDCMPGARIYDFESNKPLGETLDNMLKVTPGAYVCLWVGINNVASANGIQDTINRYFQLIKNFPKANFLIFSIPGVNEALLRGHHDATNQKVIEYNLRMRNFVGSIINQYHNVRFVNFMNERDPDFTIDGKDIRKWMDEIGLHFDPRGSSYFFNKMIQAVPR